MADSKPRTGKRRSAVRGQKCITVVDEVEAIEDLAPCAPLARGSFFGKMELMAGRRTSV
jgi:hypothetical protein